jgi:hypothetical protein
MPRVGFEPTISVFEQANTFYALAARSLWSASTYFPSYIVVPSFCKLHMMTLLPTSIICKERIYCHVSGVPWLIITGSRLDLLVLLLQSFLITINYSAVANLPTSQITRTRSILSLSLILRPTVSRPVCLGIKHPFRAYDQILITVRQLRVCWCGAFSLTRGRVCRLQLLLALASAVILESESLGTRDHIYCLRFETSFFVVSYDTQGHGGGIRPRLHTDDAPFSFSFSRIILQHGPHGKHFLKNACLLARYRQRMSYCFCEITWPYASRYKAVWAEMR